MPSRVPPNIELPSDMEDQQRRALTEILSKHAEQINHTAFDITTISSATIVAHDVVLIDATGTATVVATLVPAKDWRDKVMRIKVISSTGIGLIAAQSGETIDGTATASISGSLHCFQLVSNGDNWFIV